MRGALAILGLRSLAAGNGPTPDSLRTATQQLLHDWAEARHFKGQKRVTSGERKRYDFAAWANHRTRMLANKPEVAVEEVHIETWRDANSKLRPGLVRVHFLQRWRSPRYADHGPKIMQLFQSPDGKLHIIYEALLQSRPGWDRRGVADARHSRQELGAGAGGAARHAAAAPHDGARPRRRRRLRLQ